MIGGLLSKTSSRLALLAAAGFLMGGVATPSAKAADLGGDCCADLEERVAELEATTARKGNRRMSLTISGQVSRSIIYWDDGVRSGTAAGLDNHNQSTRFVFSGSARINPTWMAGFEFMTEIGLGARTSSASNAAGINGANQGVNVDGSWGADPLLAVRTANWWLEEKTLGRVTVGRINLSGPVATIDLGGISTAAHFSPGLAGGGYNFRTGAEAIVAGSLYTMAALIGPTYGGDRIEGIRWDSASFGGFVAQAAWGEDDVWSASLRYASEFAGFRVAAGIGYVSQQDGQLDQALAVGTCGPAAAGAVNNQTCLHQGNTVARGTEEWAGSLALMHVASGLFAQGHYARTEFGQIATAPEATFWMVQAGITKNYTGLGNTSFYGEYGRANGFGQITASSVALTTTPTPVASGRDSEVTFFGLGVVQQIDAAAMEVFIGWRRFDPTVTGAGNLAGAGPVTGIAAPASGLQELDLIHGGARIRF